jgi:hypothetical protein
MNEDYRFQQIEGHLCISPAATAAALGIEFERAMNNVKKGLERYRNGDTDSWQYYVDSDDARRRWIVLDALPNITRERVFNFYGDPALTYWSERLGQEAAARIIPQDRSWFLSVETYRGKRLEMEKVVQLCEACGWLRLTGSNWWLDKFDRYRVFLDATVQALAPRNLYGLRLTNVRSLERKLKQWQTEGREALLHGHYVNGNANRRKLDDVAIRRIVQLYASPMKPSAAKVAEVFNQEAPSKGWEQVSYERVRQIINLPAHKQVIHLARHGKDAAKNAHERTMKRRRPSFADALWFSDGSALQLYYLDKDGKPRSDLYAYVVADAYSDMIIGWAVGYTETGTLVQRAFRDAVRKTMNMPHQIGYDNSGANKGKEAQQLFQHLAKLHFPSAPYNGKAKTIEAIWGRIEQDNLRHFENFKGGNITARSLNTRANPDHLQRLFRSGQLPAFEAVLAQFELAIEVHNNTVSKSLGETPRQRYAHPHELRAKMDYLLFVEALWVERSNKARYTKDGITIEVDKQRYTYEVESERGVEDIKFRMAYLGESFTVRYDPEDLDTIALYKSGVFIASANRKYEMPMARIDIEEGEGQIISKSLKQREEYWERLAREAQELHEGMEVLGFEPLSHRLLHKDAYNRMEGEALDELIAAAAVVPVTPQQKKQEPRYRLYDDSDADGRVLGEL